MAISRWSFWDRREFSSKTPHVNLTLITAQAESERAKRALPFALKPNQSFEHSMKTATFDLGLSDLIKISKNYSLHSRFRKSGHRINFNFGIQ